MQEQSDPDSKKWVDLAESNRKLLELARTQLRQGNLLQAKSILDSLKRTHQFKKEHFPAHLRPTFELLQQQASHCLKELRTSLTPTKKSQVQTQSS